MKKRIIFSLLVVTVFSSCVSKKVYTDLEGKLAQQKKENRTLADENAGLLKDKESLIVEVEAQKNEVSKGKKEAERLNANINALKEKIKILEDAYNALEKNSSSALQANMKKNSQLLSQLEQQSKDLADEKARLSESTKRLEELEGLIAAKEETMKKLKETLSKALNSFEGKGLTVEQKNGKVYVSMENKLLFDSGSWSINSVGKSAVEELGKVLGDNPDISVLIEGHTDNDPFSGSGAITDNWDLSTKRATAIVAILSENKNINKANLTAAGRGEYSPLASNATTEGKAKNRRIEVILTPRLDEISKMLNDF